jgi:predicted Mrr-cat superfamily restriction endonuclease
MEFEKQKAFSKVLRLSRRFMLGQVGSFYRHSMETITSFCHAKTVPWISSSLATVGRLDFIANPA